MSCLSAGAASAVVLPGGVLRSVSGHVEASASMPQQGLVDLVTSSASILHITERAEVDLLCALRSALPQWQPRVVVDFPLGQIGASMLYRRKWDDVSNDREAIAMDCAERCGARVIGWQRSALGCRYEGSHVQAIAAGEAVSRLYALGCDTIILEQGVCGLTPRWFERALKTVSAVGAPVDKLGVSLCSDEDLTEGVVQAAIYFGVSTFATTSLLRCSGLRTSQAEYDEADKVLKERAVGDQRVGTDEVIQAILLQASAQGMNTDEVSTAALELCRKHCARSNT